MAAYSNIYWDKFESYSGTELVSLFSTETWKGLSFVDKLTACQEVENRYAAAYHVEPCKIEHDWIYGKEYGEYNQGTHTICLNTNLLMDGQFSFRMSGNGENNECIMPVNAAGWQVLNTVYHEGTHGLQASREEQTSAYIDAETDYDLYRIQRMEKEAYAQAEKLTLAAINRYEESTGKSDPEKELYLDSLKAESFQVALANAIKNYNDPDIEKTLATVLYDRDHGITRENASESYNRINSLFDGHHIQNSNDFKNAITDGTQTSTPNGRDNRDMTNTNDGKNNLDDSAKSVSEKEAADTATLDDGAKLDESEESSDVLDDGAELDESEEGSSVLDDGAELDESEEGSSVLDDGGLSKNQDQEGPTAVQDPGEGSGKNSGGPDSGSDHGYNDD